MAKEIERKFLVDQGLLPKNIIGEEYIQAYIAINDQGIVRIRIKGSIALLTIKTSEKGMTRNEFEYEVSGLSFDQYQIKIVFVSSNQAYSPIIKELRAIALAV